MVITPGEIKELANIGRKYVEEDRKKHILHWLGHLPSEQEIEYFFQNLEDAANWGVVEINIEEEKIMSDFDFNDYFEQEEKILAEELNISQEIAGMVLYFRSRSRWTEEREKILIEKMQNDSLTWNQILAGEHFWES